MTTHSEFARQWIHIGSGLFALLLRVIPWWQATALAALALLFNLVLLPRIGGRRLYRPADEARGVPLGILLYPLSVLLLTLTFPSRLDIVAAAWGILACGDGAATLVGRASRLNAETQSTQRNLSHGPLRTLRTLRSNVGSCRGTPRRRSPARSRSSCSARWRASRSPGGCGRRSRRCRRWPSRSLAPIAAALAAAFVETIPVRLDDNVSVPAAAGAVLWVASLMTPAALAAAADAVVARASLGDRRQRGHGRARISARRACRCRAPSAAPSSAPSSIVGGGAGAWVLLFATFIAATVTSRLGLEAEGRCSGSRKSAEDGAAPATPLPTAAWRRSPRSSRSPPRTPRRRCSRWSPR